MLSARDFNLLNNNNIQKINTCWKRIKETIMRDTAFGV